MLQSFRSPVDAACALYLESSPKQIGDAPSHKQADALTPPTIGDPYSGRTGVVRDVEVCSVGDVFKAGVSMLAVQH